MSIHVALNHVMHYRYDRSVNLGPQIIRLRPAPHCRTRILSYSLNIEPAEHFVNWQQDPQSNYLARVVFPKPTQELRVEVDLIAEMAVQNPFDFFLEPYAQRIPFKYDAAEVGLAPFLLASPPSSPPTPLFAKYLAAISREPRPTIDFLVELNRRLAADVSYVIRLQPGVQLPEETLDKRSGSCRDSAELLVQLLRHLGLAARFVSGYLIQLVADSKPTEGPAGPSRDFTDLHAWCEVYLPGAGWIGLDPTSGLLTGEGHIPLSCTPDPQSAAPLSGAVDDCQTTFEYAMKVERVWQAPRVTKPYSEEQWSEIDSLGKRIDVELRASDVRLTMGGEPTFVSSEDARAPEWNTEALGDRKRKIAARLFRELKARYAPLGLAHFGQGKWYPGEQLPRWSLNCFWRKDGEAIWKDGALIADETRPYAEATANAPRLLRAVAERLGVCAENVFAAYEDVFYYLLRERKLPANVDPANSKLADPLERARLARILEGELGDPVGYVLPIARAIDGASWQSGRWYLRRERCYLIPGDSPIGYRLPLDSLPAVSPSDFPHVYPPDPTQDFGVLAPHKGLLDKREAVADSRKKSAAPDAIAPGQDGTAAQGQDGTAAQGQDGTAAPGQDGTAAPGQDGTAATGRDGTAAPGQDGTKVIRTSMCVQARDGVLYVFMPPTRSLDDYLQIIAAVEASARALRLPVVLEGYEPPQDPRLLNFKVTPDPGVIEVNVQPSASWDELAAHTVHLYETARDCGLRPEKFMIDGRHVGTGGGNHIVMGGATPQDSPFLRRPDLLRSLISYWHNHPSLSYLFSGLFIGPTSQAPRVDEARNDSLYELEIAFQQFPKLGLEVAPWLVDRLLRNILIDVTGNTHRAEFCIDKLYSPDTASGRLGLLEMRAFEMPPHARMSLVQQLLLRSLVARFWREPYAPARLMRWGTQLHDRFLLPHFILQDFSDVIEEQKLAGFDMSLDWFAPHFEFRFPKLGDIAVRGALLELRQALEPWHVMGEEGAPGGAVRYVDSSVERVEVKVSGLAADRHVVTCNSRAIPLRPTGRAGEFVAGVRYRAWQPWSALHPTIGIHAPLTFDIVDTWMKRSEGGCRYHVVHPGGRSHETFPVNAFEAEAGVWPDFSGSAIRRVTSASSRPSRAMNSLSRWTCAIIDKDPRLGSYRSDPHRYDELLDGAGQVRSHWQSLIDGIFEDDARAARRATEFTRRMIVENGITYNVYADLKGRDRPWVLDPLPYLICAQEWQAIEAGVAQRACLLNAVLADLYGKQELLSRGELPAEIPFGHPNFLWPCRGIQLPGDRWLSVYAADLARAADGRWWVLADRTQAPSGPGYALENRQIVRRAFPHLAQSMDVRPLGAFFAALRDELLRGAEEEPLAVVLTPGSFNETYFEHAYLARQLGFPLVEGHDLTVRDESVFLKMLSGLRRVHTILRRLDDDFCDPVELRVDSALGVPGLLAAVRKGNVAVANALGSGVLESAAWLGFLPAVAQRLIGEKLRLPSVASWWCGEPPAFAAVIANLSNLVIKTSYPNQKLGPIFGSELNAEERDALIARMRARPHAYVAQEHLAFSQAPVWYTKNADGFSARALGIRVYAIATPNGYRVMPGGLARFASDAHAEIVSMQRGGGSKDIWVLCDSEDASEEATAPIARVDRAPQRHQELPSTLVENLFWMGRYAERCDYKTRLLRATLGLRRNLPFRGQAMEICKHFGAVAVFETEKRFTLRGDIERLGECAAQVRGSLSGENWRALTVLQRDFLRAEAARSDARETLDSLLLSLAALAGFALDDMTQDDGWRLMMIGRRLERLQFLADLLSRRLISAGTPLRQELEWILEIGDSAVTYRTRYRTPPMWDTTIDLLVYDEKNPRALAFQWRAINTLLIEVAESLGSKPQETLYEAVSNLLELKYANLGGEPDIVQASRRLLSQCLKNLMAAAAQLSEQLTSQHFSHIDFDLSAVSA